MKCRRELICRNAVALLLKNNYTKFQASVAADRRLQCCSGAKLMTRTFFHIEVRPSSQFIAFRVQDVGAPGGVSNTTGRAGGE
jgi:hypothetical protein